MLIAAALLMVVVSMLHSYLGERYILVRLLRQTDLPKLKGDRAFTEQTLRFAWHLTTALGCGLAVALLAGSGLWPGVSVRQVIGVTVAVSAIGSAVGTRGRHFSWVALGVIAILIWLG